MSEARLLTDAVAALLQRHCTPAFVRAVEAGAPATPLLAALSEAGFLEIMADEAAGGAELPLAGLATIAMLLGAHAAPLPLAQTMATRLLAAPGFEWPEGALTWAPSLRHLGSGREASVECALVPFGAVARHVVVPWGEGLALFDAAAAARTASGVAGALSATLRWPAGTPPVMLPLVGPLSAPLAAAGAAPGAALNQAPPEAACGAPARLAAFGAALHAALMAGAMQRAFDLTLDYANQRVQFGRAIGKYQAIQHQLAVMAEQVASVRMAVQWAFGGGPPRRWPGVAACAVAKARASEAAQTVAAMAHAVHGAIGITAEYELQLLTRRLHEWRIAHGSEDHWAAQLGKQFLDSGRDTVDFVRSLAS